MAVALVVLFGIASTATLFALRRQTTAQPLAAAAPSVSTSSSRTPKVDPPGSFAQVFKREGSGVIQIEAISCGGGDTGSGFLIAPDLVATVAHVVENPVTIALTSGNETSTGTVIGIDPSAEIALIRANQPFAGYVFHFSPTITSVGDPVAALGYPENLPLTLTQGSVSGLDRAISVNGYSLTGLIQTDTAVNPGNSGGPLINVAGEVVGLIDAKQRKAEGIGYAIAAADAEPRIDSWRSSGSPLAAADCAAPAGPPNGADVPTLPSDPEVAAMVGTISSYHNAINRGDYLTAWEQFTPGEKSRVSVNHLATQDATSFSFNFVLRDVTRLTSTQAIVFVTFTSIQAPGYGPEGETCDHWTLDYRMIQTYGLWLIDAALPHQGSTHTSC